MTKAMFTALALALITNTVQAEMTIGKLAEVCSPGGIEFPNAKVPETPEEKFGQAFVSELVGGVSPLLCMSYIQGMSDGAKYAKEGFPSDIVAKYIKSRVIGDTHELGDVLRCLWLVSDVVGFE